MSTIKCSDDVSVVGRIAHVKALAAWSAPSRVLIETLSTDRAANQPSSTYRPFSTPIMDSEGNSGTSTPNSRFTTQAKTADDILSAQTVGLVQLDDFRKRRADAIDAKEREALESGRATPASATDSSYVYTRPVKKSWPTEQVQ